MHLFLCSDNLPSFLLIYFKILSLKKKKRKKKDMRSTQSDRLLSIYYNVASTGMRQSIPEQAEVILFFLGSFSFLAA